jgi:Subunit ChlI of Mg-chelatase
VSLPDKTASEARERVPAALVASGLALPARRITVNLAPADVPIFLCPTRIVLGRYVAIPLAIDGPHD